MTIKQLKARLDALDSVLLRAQERVEDVVAAYSDQVFALFEVIDRFIEEQEVSEKEIK